jgi:hypothetical protein
VFDAAQKPLPSRREQHDVDLRLAAQAAKQVGERVPAFAVETR